MTACRIKEDTTNLPPRTRNATCRQFTRGIARPSPGPAGMPYPTLGPPSTCALPSSRIKRCVALPTREFGWSAASAHALGPRTTILPGCAPRRPTSCARRAHCGNRRTPASVRGPNTNRPANPIPSNDPSVHDLQGRAATASVWHPKDRRRLARRNAAARSGIEPAPLSPISTERRHVKNLLLLGCTAFLLAAAVITTSPENRRHSAHATASDHASAPLSIF